MAINEDALNDALNTPTDELEDQADDHVNGYDAEEDEYVEPEEQDEEIEAAEPEDDVEALLEVEEKPKSTNRVQRLANEKREASERAERAEREAADLRARLANDDNERLRRAQEERQRVLDEMDPTDRRLYLAEQDARQARFEAADNRDLSTFAAMVQQHPQMRGLAQEVEQELTRARAAGQNPSRQQVAQFLLGQKAMKNLMEAPKKQKAGKARVEQARGRPMNAGSNAAPQQRAGRGNSLSDVEKRLEGVKL